MVATAKCRRSPHRRWDLRPARSRPNERLIGECNPSAATRYRAVRPAAVTEVSRWLMSVTRRPCTRIPAAVTADSSAACRSVRLAPIPDPEWNSDSALCLPSKYPIPRNSRPGGSTPSPRSATTAPGIRPSPQALSIGDAPDPARGSTTVTSRPRSSREQRGGEPGRAGAGDQDVDHGLASARARSSSRIRTVSSQAFSTVKVTAVIHAVCTIGSAMPSTTTAT